MNLTKGNC